MIVAGVMSGTSADGIDVALVRIENGAGSRARSQETPAGRGRVARFQTVQLLHHSSYSYPASVRRAVLGAMNAASASVADLARLNFLLGELYADAVLAAQKTARLQAALIGCHGQTIYHQGERRNFLGRRIAATWQTGEGAVIAARTGIPVVSDFRPADLAAGGQAAPLVPFLDYLLFRDDGIGRIVQNIGGIANLTAIPANAGAHQLIAFDTGPGNMVIDAVTEKLFGKPLDRGGKIAESGKTLGPVVVYFLRQKFFNAKPPKTAGREEFGREFVREFLRRCGRAAKEDIVATATAFTAASIADAVRRFVMQRNRETWPSTWEMIVSGGGVKNATLMRMLDGDLKTLGVTLRTSDEFGLPSQAKEATAFAVLACETLHRRPSNVPAATGAKRPAILGKISYP